MSRLDDFLAHHIKGYLFHDISFMEREDEKGRGVGYPLLMTCCAGIEFLGALRSRRQFNAHGMGNQYFADYWQSCLYPVPSPHRTYDQLVYQLMRHGIAHSFFTKGEIGVVRKRPDLHFTRDQNGLLLVDVVQLGRDVINSYDAYIEPVLTDASRASEKVDMERRLSEMESDFSVQAMKQSGAVASANPSPVIGATGPITQSVAPSPSSGPSGPLGPN